MGEIRKNYAMLCDILQHKKVQWKELPRKVRELGGNPLSPRSDQHQFSPRHIGCNLTQTGHENLGNDDQR